MTSGSLFSERPLQRGEIMNSRSRRMTQWIAGRAEVFMFWLSAIFLVCMAFLVVLWVDVPGVQSIAAEARAQGLTAEPAELIAGELFRNRLEIVVLSVMCVIWPIVVMEAVAHWLTRPWNQQTRRYHWFSLLFCVCPALRMCARSPEMGYRLWLPFLGWRRADKSLQRKLERMFSFPMLVIALMILPILVTEFFLKVQIAQYAWLRLLLHLGTGVIWFAFAAEFILMVSVAEKKIAYCKANWIDLAIILLPLLSFLRSLTMLRSTRLAKLMGLPQITRLARVYQLRGTLFRALRALILLEFAHRVFKTSSERRVARLKAELAESEKHARFLRLKIARLERENGVEDIAEEPAVDGE